MGLRKAPSVAAHADRRTLKYRQRQLLDYHCRQRQPSVGVSVSSPRVMAVAGGAIHTPDSSVLHAPHGSRRAPLHPTRPRLVWSECAMASVSIEESRVTVSEELEQYCLYRFQRLSACAPLPVLKKQMSCIWPHRSSERFVHLRGSCHLLARERKWCSHSQE